MNFNSLPRHSDLHRQGVYMVVGPDGVPRLDTADTTAYSARANFVRETDHRWAAHQKNGFQLAAFAMIGVATVGETEAPEDAAVIDITTFPVSGTIFGTSFCKVSGLSRRAPMANAYLEIGKPPIIVAKLPGKMSLEETEAHARALLAYVAELRAVKQPEVSSAAATA